MPTSKELTDNEKAYLEIILGESLTNSHEEERNVKSVRKLSPREDLVYKIERQMIHSILKKLSTE